MWLPRNNNEHFPRLSDISLLKRVFRYRTNFVLQQFHNSICFIIIYNQNRNWNFCPLSQNKVGISNESLKSGIFYAGYRIMRIITIKKSHFMPIIFALLKIANTTWHGNLVKTINNSRCCSIGNIFWTTGWRRLTRSFATKKSKCRGSLARKIPTSVNFELAVWSNFIFFYPSCFFQNSPQFLWKKYPISSSISHLQRNSHVFVSHWVSRFEFWHGVTSTFMKFSRKRIDACRKVLKRCQSWNFAIATFHICVANFLNSGACWHIH